MGLQRSVLAGLGWLSVGMGVIGAFVPGMPTTVFLLIALYCFSRSSPRLEAWLLGHPRFGAPLRNFRENRGMPKAAKMAALVSMWTAVSISSASLLWVSRAASLGVVGMGLLGTLTILFAVRTIPNAPN